MLMACRIFNREDIGLGPITEVVSDSLATKGAFARPNGRDIL
jgi:hypothetical protein